ncbi:phenylalanine--tRNA ligase subunit beta [Candidatus Uhrbacteria bacterium CG10_big_fil_rev_8_21_14_0_10_48_11]|uniref:Phenylalanine--tRNA ligase beta subunit n=1 Tax=Candidatus Uhrbacteria bacterium CG10_big_fil_rev_8_21_14_0_10_48_11 TaxID=1975037 RepID=A0A2M8LDX7_9BACT|nr:MAG: phenylalanine--tRNA ligase subunit beta [Candidatus Uhrbacteria bacterium CG10_big_fil_rev_8_21_14_0_10_48_11]
MQFTLPYHWLSDYLDVPKDPKEAASLLSLHGVTIDRIEHARYEFSNVVVAQIVSVEPHPNADKLQIAKVQTGTGKVKTIVCGAPNIAVGQKVPLALPGAVLPNGLTIEARSVRGVQSEGMLCASSELGLREHDNLILVLHPSAILGASIVSEGKEEDDLLEVEPTTNRPDIASVIGVARELSAITGKPLRLPKTARSTGRSKLPLSIHVQDRVRCRRFMATYVEGISVGNAPLWMQERLIRSGVRPINTIVDITNYVMLEYGQPLHAFDADKLKGALVIRPAEKGEKILTLDGRTHSLAGGELVNADDDGPVDIAGIMGGELSGVTTKTKNILFEAATWDAVDVRKTSRKLQLDSDASRLFKKGLSPVAPEEALARAVALCRTLCGGDQRGAVVDVWGKQKQKQVAIHFPVVDLVRLLGVHIPTSRVRQLLQRLGFGVSGSGSVVKVSVPYWRDQDVVASEDVVEEVARLYGYHNIAGLLPPSSSIGRDFSDLRFSNEAEIKEELRAMGFTETYSYSLISKKMLSALNINEASSLRVANPLNNDLAVMRPSLLASLVDVVEKNMSAYDTVNIFEMAKVYVPGGKGKEAIDRYRTEEVHLSGLVSESGASTERLYQIAKGTVETVLRQRGIEPSFLADAPYPFAPGAAVRVVAAGKQIGTLGILLPPFLKALGVSLSAAAFDLKLDDITARKGQMPFQAVPKFPAVKRDMSLVMGGNISYSDMVDSIRSVSPLVTEIELFDIYKGDRLKAGEYSYSLHFTLRSNDRTLTTEEVAEVEKKIEKALNKQQIRIR